MHLVPLLLAIGCGAAVLVIVLLGDQLSFFNDDWYFLLQRPGLNSHGGLNSILAPDNGNIVVLLAALFKGMAALFGLGSQLPYRLLLGLCVAALGIVVFLIVRERMGPVPALVAALVVLFLGPAWEGLLFFSTVADSGSVAAGLLALFLLERDTPRRNVAAFLLLVFSVALYSLGLPFLVGATIAILLRRRLTQLWISLIPLALFVAWWIAYQTSQQSHLSLANIEQLPKYVLDSASIGLASLTGLNRGSPGADLTRAHVLLALAAIAVAVLVYKRGRPRGWALVFAGTALSFWIIAGAQYYPGRAPISSRYQIFDVPLIIAFAAELLRGVRLSRGVTIGLVAAGLAVIASNTSPLNYGFGFMQTHSDYAKAEIGALQLARGIAPPALRLAGTVSPDPYLSGVTAGRYFAVTRTRGTPSVLSPAEIERASAGERAAADDVLIGAYTPVVRVGPSPTSLGACSRLVLGGRATVADRRLASGRALLANPGNSLLIVGVRRFASVDHAHRVGFLAPRSTVRLEIPRDEAGMPWHFEVLDPSRRPATVEVCAS